MMLQESRKIEHDLSVINWCKILIEKGYNQEQIDKLLTQYYGDNWKASLPQLEETV